MFVLDNVKNEFVKRPEKRVKIFGFLSNGFIINVLPRDFDLESVSYEINQEGHLVVTDGSGFELDIHEFGHKR